VSKFFGRLFGDDEYKVRIMNVWRWSERVLSRRSIIRSRFSVWTMRGTLEIAEIDVIDCVCSRVERRRFCTECEFAKRGCITKDDNRVLGEVIETTGE
jgi:hypothetical protein